MKTIDPSSIGLLPRSAQILLLDYMQLLDQQHHAVNVGILLPSLCSLIALSTVLMADVGVIYASSSLFITLSVFMILGGKPWTLVVVVSNLKVYRLLFQEKFHMNIDALTSNDIWAGVTIDIDTKAMAMASDTRNATHTVVQLFVSTMVFVIVLFAEIVYGNPAAIMLTVR